MDDIKTLTLAGALVITVLLSLRMICSDAFPTAQQTYAKSDCSDDTLARLAQEEQAAPLRLYSVL